jgi:hypothetical protein
MNMPTPTADAPDVPTPARFWWLKRIVVAGVVWLIVLCVLRWGWGWEADRRLAAVIADAKVRGEPVLEEDFRPPVVPEGENAAELLMTAAQSLSLQPAFHRLSSVDEFDDIPATEMSVIEQAVSANGRSLALARQASTRPAASWPPPSREPSSRRWRIDQRYLADLLYWSAMYRLETHDDNEALSIAKDLLRQADAVGHHPNQIIDRVISVVMEAKACNVINRLSRPPRAGSAAMHEDVREEAREIISLLLRDDYYHRCDVTAIYAMRKQLIETGRDVDDYLPETVDRMVLRPMYVLDVVRAAEKNGEVARGSEAPSFPASWHAPGNEPYEPYLFRESRPLNRLSHPPSPAAFYKAAVRRRAAAAKLAIRMYRDDHEGRLPPRLEDLVPDYLPAVPRDAMAASNRPLAYRPNAKPPMIYGVGDDGIDHGGVESSWKGSDQVFYLDAPPPKPPRIRRPPTSRQAQQHQANQDDAGHQGPAQRRQ